MKLAVLCLFVVFAWIPASANLHSQVPNQRAHTNPADPEGILTQLAPDDVPPMTMKLNPNEKARAIRLLIAVKRDETEWHRELAIYLLAMLGHNYVQNRDEILHIWCKDGDDGTMTLLMNLYTQGHKELLNPLLTGYNGWNAATSEGLGTFYSDELEKEPGQFLNALASFTPARQLISARPPVVQTEVEWPQESRTKYW